MQVYVSAPVRHSCGVADPAKPYSTSVESSGVVELTSSGHCGSRWGVSQSVTLCSGQSRLRAVW